MCGACGIRTYPVASSAITNTFTGKGSSRGVIKSEKRLLNEAAVSEVIEENPVVGESGPANNELENSNE